MFRPLADARYWFRSAAGLPRKNALPGALSPYGGIVVAGPEGSFEMVELDYTNRVDEKKLNRPLEKVVGIGHRDYRGNGWTCELRSELGNFRRFVGRGATFAEAVNAAAAVRRQEEDAEIALQANPVALLDRELSRHDWWHTMSDSYGVALAGERHMSKVRTLMGKVEPSVARELWAKYAPDNFPCPV